MDQDDKTAELPDEKTSPSAPPAADMVLDLNFVPSWARKPPEQTNYYVSKGGRDRDYGDADRGARGPRPSRDRRPPARGPRPERDDRRGRRRDDPRDERRGDREREDRFQRRPEPEARAPTDACASTSPR